MNILLTALLTVLTFTMGQIVDRLFIQPIQEQKRVIGKIHFALFYYANCYAIEDDVAKMSKDYVEKLKTAEDEIRKLGSELKSSTAVIPCYDEFVKLGIVFKKSIIEDAYTGHIGWSNSIFELDDKGARWAFRKQIAKALKIKLT